MTDRIENKFIFAQKTVQKGGKILRKLRMPNPFMLQILQMYMKHLWHRK